MDERMLEELKELLRIPSVSTGEPNAEALREAAGWLRDKVRRSGGDCELEETERNPLVVGHLAANRADAPTVLIYGHYDVQSVGDRSLWETDPFDPAVKDGRVYARGASDDKGNFYPLLYTACEMAQAGELPVNVRVLVEGDEETAGEPVLRWIAEDTGPADCCIIYDSGSPDPSVPAITLGTRGVLQVRVTVRGARQDLHSGIFGGSVVNALHELVRMLEGVLPGPDGILRDELRAGIQPLSEAEKASWSRLPDPGALFELAGAVPLTEESGARYYAQNMGEPSLEVTEVKAGEPRTIVPSVATAFVTIRTAPGQDAKALLRTLKDLLRERAHPGAEVEFSGEMAVDAGWFDPESPPLRLARRAFAEVGGTEPILFRLGATLPLLAPLARRGVPTVLTGFAGFDDGFHAPNESYRLESLELGARAARALYTHLAELR